MTTTSFAFRLGHPLAVLVLLAASPALPAPALDMLTHEDVHLAVAPSVPAPAQDMHVHQGVHMAVAPSELQWKDGPGSLPPGAQFVVVEGNPAEPGPLMLRLKFPANYAVPAHTHPAIEHITVLEGVLNVGMGDVLDRDASRAMETGSFIVMPIGHTHFVWTEEEVVLQLHSMGPWGITYVDPADDPRTPTN